MPNKFNVYFGDDDFESVNQESSTSTFEQESKSDDLDVIHSNIKLIKGSMAHTIRIVYFITNNVEAIMDILTKYELLELEIGT